MLAARTFGIAVAVGLLLGAAASGYAGSPNGPGHDALFGEAEVEFKGNSTATITVCVIEAPEQGGRGISRLWVHVYDSRGQRVVAAFNDPVRHFFRGERGVLVPVSWTVSNVKMEKFRVKLFWVEEAPPFGKDANSQSDTVRGNVAWIAWN